MFCLHSDKDTVISVDAMKADGGVEVELHSFPA